MNLFKVIRDDLLITRCINLSCYEDIFHLRELTGEWSKWKKVFSNF